jgi:hypothetical protein
LHNVFVFAVSIGLAVALGAICLTAMFVLFMARPLRAFVEKVKALRSMKI